jgi:hypothetical protein
LRGSRTLRRPELRAKREEVQQTQPPRPHAREQQRVEQQRESSNASALVSCAIPQRRDARKQHYELRTPIHKAHAQPVKRTNYKNTNTEHLPSIPRADLLH